MKTSILAASVAALCVFAGVAGAQVDLPRTHLKVVGAWGMLTQYKNFEQPFWNKRIPERSRGAVTAEITPFNEMGLKGAEITRLMRMGVIDFGSTVLGYVAGDDARNEAVDLAGIAPDAATARRITEAYKPVYDRFYREKFGVQVLGIWPYSAQVLFCNGDIRGLADLKGRKVRTAGRSLAEFVQALGGTGVTMAFSEVVPALQNRVIDCAITGTLSGNSAKWYEVATHIYMLPLGWSPVMHGVNLKTWQRLDPRVQAFLKAEVERLEDEIWKAAEVETQQGFDCNAGRDGCTAGTKAKLVLVPVSAGDKALLRRVLVETVLPQWAARCPDADCVGSFNRTIGQVIGLQAPAK
jgi:TRAP-type C4-dicarboxylate transport system substrate-binding protein